MKILLAAVCLLVSAQATPKPHTPRPHTTHAHHTPRPHTTRPHHTARPHTTAPPATPQPAVEDRVKALEDALRDLKGKGDQVKELQDVIGGLSRQVMLQQFYLEEKVRSDGNSGLKQLRVAQDGTRNYYSGAHIAGARAMNTHDHANYDRTAGLGELMVVMNGVEFKTRHNDYKLKMPCRNCTDFNKMEDIPFPPTPPSVLKKPTVLEQAMEMREYFRAFKEQNITHRDYRPYFKANLCYLEGAWVTGTGAIDEPFQSDRHQIDASSWFGLMDKARYTGVTGSKSVLENFATLPTNIMAVKDGKPQYVQWNYRILCHPLKDDLPTKYFEPDDDLLHRFPNRLNVDRTLNSRAQRFHLNGKPGVDHISAGRSLIDDLMMQVPGKDNYPAKLFDHSFDMVMEDVRYNNHTLVNTGYYHRYFKTMDQGAMGIKSIHRGYNDANLWVALTSHPQVAPISVEDCHLEGDKGHKQEVCKTFTNRVTYALPLEVVYLTPLQAWNPYDIPIRDYRHTFSVVLGDHRTGELSQDKALNGSSPFKYYYNTPAEFYSAHTSGKHDMADTARNNAAVLDKTGKMRIVQSSGIRIITPDIETVGQVRTRYAIMPVHGEGEAVWKELNALKDMTMHMNRYSSLFEERPGAKVANGTDASGMLQYHVRETNQDPPGQHGHDVFLNQEELDEMKAGKMVELTTSYAQGHTHDLRLRWNPPTKTLHINQCDGLSQCWDGHYLRLDPVLH